MRNKRELQDIVEIKQIIAKNKEIIDVMIRLNQSLNNENYSVKRNLTNNVNHVNQLRINDMQG